MADVSITDALKSDLTVILDLQYRAYQSEAILLDDFTIPPLRQTIGEVEKEFEAGTILKAVDQTGIIVGSVRAHRRDGAIHIGKLIVEPVRQGQGIGSRLLAAIEQRYPHERYELFTSGKSERNLKLYEKNGYQPFRTLSGEDYDIIFLEKIPVQELQSLT